MQHTFLSQSLSLSLSISLSSLSLSISLFLSISLSLSLSLSPPLSLSLFLAFSCLFLAVYIYIYILLYIYIDIYNNYIDIHKCCIHPLASTLSPCMYIYIYRYSLFWGPLFFWACFAVFVQKWLNFPGFYAPLFLQKGANFGRWRPFPPPKGSP